MTNGCQLRRRSLKVRCLSRLEAHTNLDRVQRVCVYFGVSITAAVIEQRFVDNREADQASTRTVRTCNWGKMSLEDASTMRTEYPYVHTSLTNHHASEVMFPSPGKSRPKRQDRRLDRDGLVVKYYVQSELPALKYRLY